MEQSSAEEVHSTRRYQEAEDPEVVRSPVKGRAQLTDQQRTEVVPEAGRITLRTKTVRNIRLLNQCQLQLTKCIFLVTCSRQCDGTPTDLLQKSYKLKYPAVPETNLNRRSRRQPTFGDRLDGQREIVCPKEGLGKCGGEDVDKGYRKRIDGVLQTWTTSRSDKHQLYRYCISTELCDGIMGERTR